MGSSSRRIRRRRKIRHAIRRNPVGASLLNLFWPRSTMAPTSPSAFRAERRKVLGFGISLVVVVIAALMLIATKSPECSTPHDIEEIE